MTVQPSNIKFFWTQNVSYWEAGKNLPQNNFLNSAWSMLDGQVGKDKSVRIKTISEKREKYVDKFFVDSGMLSALIHHEKRWMDAQKYIVEQTAALRPDIISHVDIPMTPRFLFENGITGEQAMAKTIKNAEEFMSIDTPATKCFVVQGWTKDQYKDCIKAFDDMGVFDGKNWVGLGSTCVREPDLYKIYNYCIKEIRAINPDQHIHVLGISKPEWLAELTRMNINSGDSMALARRTFMGELLLGSGKTVSVELRPLHTQAQVALYVLNSWSWWTKYQDFLNKKKTTLHEFIADYKAEEWDGKEDTAYEDSYVEEEVMIERD